MRNIRYASRVIRAATLCFVLLGQPFYATAVTTADQVCPPASDPCSVTTAFTVDNGATLDFGTRTLRITNNGRFNIGAATATIKCGALQILRTGKAIDIATVDLGGDLTIEVRGRCTAGPALSCMTDTECSAFGGVCDRSTADAQIAGGIDGDSRSPGFFVLSAAGDVSVQSDISMNGTNLDADGGDIIIEAGGALTTTAKISATAGSDSGGGTIELDAGADATIAGEIDARGGSFDGGEISVTTAQALRVTAPVDASAISADGIGGDILLSAGTDLRCEGGTPAVRQVLSVDGAGSGEGFGGDGGTLEISAGGDMFFGPFVRIRARGAAPDGFGGELEFAATRDLTFSGEIQGNARGASGGGGLVDFAAGEFLSLGGAIDLDGGNLGDSGILLVLGKNLVISGTLVLAGQPFGSGSTVIDVHGCNVDLTSSASWDNASSGGATEFTVLNEITALSGAAIRATSGGQNRIRIRDGTLPPAAVAAFTPAPAAIIDAALPECARCGDGTVGAGETCDDGNMSAGDGCGDTCQLESCIAETPGWPGVPLCDDGFECTLDICDTGAEACFHITNCDDGIDCTEDFCDVDGSCKHLVSDALCEDGNPCTNGICTMASGCFQFFFEDTPCDDNLTCTVDDMCSDGLCVGAPSCPAGQICLPASDTCGTPTTTSSTTTTTVTTTTTTTTTSSTTTTTLAGGNCGDGGVDSGEDCDPGGVSWTPGLYCRDDCTAVDCGDPNDSGDIAASDALFVLLAAVGSVACDCVCDVDGNLAITASDALRALRAAVGVAVGLSCACG